MTGPDTDDGLDRAARELQEARAATARVGELLDQADQQLSAALGGSREAAGSDE